ncbi:PEP-CTERM sorting domain-containing protein [Microcoleus sp. ARI1-B5]|uniref:PEP-CTERM sorting domain-containing protein n=1 Tax=unclassified Microcoleus TaxID=2642155 RepID=UPI002FD67344
MKLTPRTGAILFEGFANAFLLATPLVTGLTVGIAPSSAATIAGSAAEVSIDNFSHRPTETGTSTNTNTQTIANQGIVISEAKADAVFISNCQELLAANLSKSEVAGSGSNYAGLAQSQAKVIGDFDIDAAETFSFNFQTVLHLFTSVDNNKSERARAIGSISFSLINTVTDILLDSFQLVSSLDSSGGRSLNLSADNSFHPTAINFNFMTEGSATKSLLYTSGVYSRTFDSATKLTLVEVKNNFAEAEAQPEAVPEPSTVLGTAIFLGLFVRARKLKNKLSEIPSKV